MLVYDSRFMLSLSSLQNFKLVYIPVVKNYLLHAHMKTLFMIPVRLFVEFSWEGDMAMTSFAEDHCSDRKNVMLLDLVSIPTADRVRHSLKQTGMMFDSYLL